MLDINNVRKSTIPEPPSPSAEEAVTPASPNTGRHHSPSGLLRAIKRYPIPLGSAVLLLVSLVLWLTRHGDTARWTLLAIVLLGGIPLLWETVRQFFHQEFSVDVIAILAIGGSLLFGQYLAGAVVVLMLSGGEALEASRP